MRRKSETTSQKDFIDAMDKNLLEAMGIAMAPEDEQVAYANVKRP